MFITRSVFWVNPESHTPMYTEHPRGTGGVGRRRLLPPYQVAGLSGTMVWSCHAARPERAEQWSRSADGAGEGTARRSVSRVQRCAGYCGPGPSLSLLARTMESGRSRAAAEMQGGEFPACYNKMNSSILVTEGIGQELWATPRIGFRWSHFSGSACSWRLSIHGSLVHSHGPPLVT